jgi:sugar phosphate isomerase/epimerase
MYIKSLFHTMVKVKMGHAVSKLGCSELCFGGKFEDKLEFIEKLGLWLELVNVGPRDTSSLNSYTVDVKTVQAYKLHEFHRLSSKRETREAANAHVLETLRVAEDVEAEYVLTVPSYGFDLLERPRQECIWNYQKIARETHLGVLIEALSPKQTSFLPSLPAVARLVEEISMENVLLAADTWHIEEADMDVIQTLHELGDKVVELHLKDTNSKPPGTGEMDFGAILNTCAPKNLCLEFKSTTKAEFMSSFNHIKSLMAEAPQT